jgi:hypothetical protein
MQDMASKKRLQEQDIAQELILDTDSHEDMLCFLVWHRHKQNKTSSVVSVCKANYTVWATATCWQS